MSISSDEENSITQEAFTLVSTLMKEYDASHDIEHVKRVIRLADDIAKDIGVTDTDTLEIITLGATLHDVGDYKYGGKEQLNVLDQLFNKFNYPQDKRKRVLHVVNNVGFSSELKRIEIERSYGATSYKFLPCGTICFVQRDPEYHTLELCIVQDADRIEALGAIGIARCIFYTATKNGLIYDPYVKPNTQLTSESYKGQQSPGRKNAAITHFYEKLFMLQYLMKTHKGRSLAIERTKIMKFYVDALEAEWFSSESK